MSKRTRRFTIMRRYQFRGGAEVGRLRGWETRLEDEINDIRDRLNRLEHGEV